MGYALLTLKAQIATNRLKSWAPNMARLLEQTEQINFLLRR
jgi:hypothetical protein